MILSHCDRCIRSTETTPGDRCLDCGTDKSPAAREVPSRPVFSCASPFRIATLPRWGRTRGDA